MSPILFNIALEKVKKEMSIIPQDVIHFHGSPVGLLSYADSLVLINESKYGLRSLFCGLGKVVLKIGLHINEDKTE